MSEAKISPLFMLELVDKVEKELWNKFESAKYKKVQAYINKWHKVEGDGWNNDYWENFQIHNRDDGNIDLTSTLNGMDDELLFQVAVDLGIEVPGLIYSVAEIKGILAEKYERASNIFDNAIQKIYSEPDIAVQMANSALETIIKKICKDPNIESCKNGKTLYDLTQHILKQFDHYPDKKTNENIRNIGSGLLKACQSIESLRSENTKAHGLDDADHIIEKPVHAMLVVNSVATIGLFLLNYYEKEFKVISNDNEQKEWDLDDEIPF